MGEITLSAGVRQNLLSLQNTADLMSTTQNRLATGKKVNSALDNPTNFFTSQSLQARSNDLNSLMDSMSNGIKTLEAADNGLKAITKNLESMQSTLRQARQDKSFNTQSYDVTDSTVLNLSGGAGVDVTNFSLPADTSGNKATVTGSAAYTGPAIATFDGSNVTNSAAGGAGGRTVLSFDDITTDLAGQTITVDGVDVTFAAGAATDTADEIITQMQTALGADYKVGKNAGNTEIVIENVATPGAGSASPVVDLGASAATAGKAVFTYDADRMGTTINVDGTDVTVGGDIESFAANMQSALGSNYAVSVDTSTNEITVASTVVGASSTPSITGGALSATAAETTFTYDNTEAQALTIGGTSIAFNAAETDANIISAFQADTTFDAAYSISSDGSGNFTVTSKNPGVETAPTVTNAAAATFTLDTTGGQDLTIGGTTLTLGAGDTDANVIAAFEADGTFDAAYSITSDGAGNFTVVSKTAGAGTGPAVSSTVGGQLTSVVAYSPTGVSVSNVTGVDGEAAVPVTTTAGTDGARQAAVAAASDKFTVNYGNQTTEITIGSDGSFDQAETVAAVNAQLAAAGISGVEASFDADGNFAIAATKAESKLLSITGAGAATVFGSGDLSNKGAPSTNATSTVDRFVEILNTEQAGKLRASNDNGKLRIENLSTTDLGVSVDKDGAGAGLATSSTIKGNSVRANMASQYNELRDQLDKLSDDASFNGINLLRGDKLTITFNETGTSSIDIQSKDAKTVNSDNLGLSSQIEGSALDSDDSIDTMLAQVKVAMNSIRSQASAFGSNLSQVENRQDFTKNMMNTLQTGADNLVLADTNEEAANMLALQTRQQLSSTALSMASQADQAALRLF